MGIKLGSRSKERNNGGIASSIVKTGSRSDIEAEYVALLPGMVTDDGKVSSVRMYQESPNIWACEIRYSSDLDGNDNDEPNTVYGKKSAQLTGSMLSLDIECHPSYLTCWNHFLAAAPKVSQVPGFWSSSKDGAMSDADAEKYAWIKSLSEIPRDDKGRWKILKKPLKPGVNTFDVAVYTLTETVKCRSAAEAGAFVAGILNKIGTPSVNLGITSGDWKCDNANVFWGGKAWFATLTWSRSGNSQGWDKDIYGVAL